MDSLAKEPPKLSEKGRPISGCFVTTGPVPNSTPCTNIASRSGCLRRLIYPAWVYRRPPRPNSIRYMPLKEAGRNLEFFEKIRSGQGKTGGESTLLVAGRRGDSVALKHGSDAFALAYRKWEDFQEINPHPEYTEAVQAALDKALKLQPGQPAPEFTLHDLDGQPVSLSQFKGQVVLLDFWASWCGPCISDLPDLRRIKEKNGYSAGRLPQRVAGHGRCRLARGD